MKYHSLLIALLWLAGCGERRVGADWEVVVAHTGSPALWHDGQQLWFSSSCKDGLKRVDVQGAGFELTPIAGVAGTHFIPCSAQSAHLVGADRRSYFFDGSAWSSFPDAPTLVTAGGFCSGAGAYAAMRDTLLLRKHDGQRWRVHWHDPAAANGWRFRAVAGRCTDEGCTIWAAGEGRSIMIDPAGGISPIAEFEGELMRDVRAFRDGPRTRLFATSHVNVYELDDGGPTPRWRSTERPFPLAWHRGRSWSWDVHRQRMVETSASGESHDAGLAFSETAEVVTRTITAALIVDGWLWVAGYDRQRNTWGPAVVTCHGLAHHAFIARRRIDDFY